MNFVTYDEYVALFSDWQARLLGVADNISVSGNVYVRRYWRNKLAAEFKTFLEEVNEIEFKTSQQQMTPSLRFEDTQKIKMSETTTNEDDVSTVNGDVSGLDGDFDYDEEGSVDMMFDDLNVLRDEYQMFMRMTDREIAENEIPMIEEIIDTLHSSFKQIRDTIVRRMHWTERIANDAIGWIDRPRTQVYLQNTGRDLPVIETDVEATMIDSNNYNYGIMVPARVFDDYGFTDYSISGRQI